MALLLRLRRASTHHPQAAQLVERAQTILDELRSVVWSLRNEQGTLGELGKLIDARTRLLRRKLGYERSTPTEQTTLLIGPTTAVTALTAAQELVQQASSAEGVTRLYLQLYVDVDLVLALEHDGAMEPLRATIPLDAQVIGEDGRELSRALAFPWRTTTYFRRHSPGRSLPRPSTVITHSQPSGHAPFIDGSHDIWQVEPASTCAKLVPAAHVSPFPQSAVEVHGVPIRSSD